MLQDQIMIPHFQDRLLLPSEKARARVLQDTPEEVRETFPILCDSKTRRDKYGL